MLLLKITSTNCRSFCQNLAIKVHGRRSAFWSDKETFCSRLLFGGSVVVPPSVRFLSASSSSSSAISSRSQDKVVGKMADANASQQESSGSVSSGVGAGATTTNGNVDRSKCIFCKIADGKEPNEIYYQDDEIIVFQDIRPAAKYHFLVVTREHIRDCKTLVASQLGLVERLVQVGNQVLEEQMQKDGGGSPEQVQKLMGFHWPPFHTVSHLHLHVIAPSNQMGFMARTIFRPGLWFVTADYVRERLQKMGASADGGGTQ